METKQTGLTHENVVSEMDILEKRSMTFKKGQPIIVSFGFGRVYTEAYKSQISVDTDLPKGKYAEDQVKLIFNKGKLTLTWK